MRLGPRSAGPHGGYWQGFASFRVLCALALVATFSAAHAPGVSIGARMPQLHPAEEVPGASPCPAAPAAAEGGRAVLRAVMGLAPSGPGARG